MICFYKKVWKMENISILYIGFGPKIQFFLEAAPACLPLFASPTAQLVA
jgi:hypothetical protein